MTVVADPTTHHVVGTAGHIDHGKTALVRALTGHDTDRLPEERERGISIDLGFAPLDLGPNAVAASVVDVPGHEGFVKNMVAGASGIDAVLFVVAADEGLMPQSREHLLVLRALGVDRGVVAITKADLVDPEWVELVAETVREELRDSALGEAPIVAVSSRSGEGVEAVRAALADAVAGATPRRFDFPFRMPVDRAFSVTGVGTVVTGTVWSGGIEEGALLAALPPGERARVRTIEVHGAPVERAIPGCRTALGLAGAGEAFARGAMLVEEGLPWRARKRLEVRAWLDGSAPRPLRAKDRVRVHHGTREVMGRVRWYEDDRVAPGGEGLALLELEAGIVAAVGDAIVLRAYSPVETIGGGRVLALGGRRLRGAAKAARHSALSSVSVDPAGRLVGALELAGLRGLAVAELPIATGLGASGLAAAARTAEERIEDLQGRWYASSARRSTMDRILSALEAYHEREPLQPGMPLEAARQTARAARPALVESAIDALVADGQVERRDATLARTGHRVVLDPGDARLVDQTLLRYREAGLEPPETRALAEELGIEAGRLRDLLAHLEREGLLAKLASDWYADVDALARAERLLVERLEDEAEGAETGAFKEMFGVTRKYLIPILEYFDRGGVTRREGNRRVLARRS